MTERRTFIGVDRLMVDRIDSLDEKWIVEFWVVKYYFFGIEIHTQKKEIVKHNHKHSSFLLDYL